MKKYSLLRSAAGLLALVSMSGCASIVSGSRKNVSIVSNPPGAHVSVADKKGREVAALTTPCVANLKRSDGFFVGAHYVATVAKPGYQTQRVDIASTVNPWIFGNLLFGGVIGILIVDPATGATFDLTPSKIDTRLVPTAKH